MKKLGLLFVAFGLSVAANAQLRVDSLGRSEFGVIPRENFDKIADATVTVYGEDAKSTMNLYMPSVKKQALDLSSPYFIQCVSGTSNEGGIGNQKYTRRFYVTGSGDVYAKGTVIQPAVDPSFSSGGSIGAGGVVSRSKAADSQSPLSRLSNISGVSYAVEEQFSGDAAPMDALLEIGQPSLRLGLLAEEVEAGVPEAVVTLYDGSKGISYSDLSSAMASPMTCRRRASASTTCKASKSSASTWPTGKGRWWSPPPSCVPGCTSIPSSPTDRKSIRAG